MTIAIVVVILLGYVFIATEHVTHVNKALIALFCVTVGWVLFMCTGTSFINGMHAEEYLDFLGGRSRLYRQARSFFPNISSCDTWDRWANWFCTFWQQCR